MPKKCTPLSCSPRQCGQCGAAYTARGRNSVYCTPACAKEARRLKVIGYTRAYRGMPLPDGYVPARPYRNRLDVPCEMCGKVTSKPVSQVLKAKRQFCSTDCMHAGAIKTEPKPTGTCVVCGSTFEAEQYQFDAGRKLCGRKCQGRLASDGDPLGRLHKKSVRLPNGCLVRTVRIMPSGYSNICWRGKTIGAHVLAYLLANGLDSIPKGWDVSHACPGGDNKACIEPTHLYLRTHAKNIQEASERGSMPAKLNPDLVRAMRLEWDAGGITMTALAAKYGVSDMTARSAILRQTWAWVE